MKSSRLIERRNKLNEFVKNIHIGNGNDFMDSTDTRNLDMEMDSLDHVLGLDTLERYREMIEIAKSKDVNTIYDIGCAYGHQSEAFIESGVEYIGVNDDDLINYWNKDRYKYINQRYPFRIEKNKNSMAVSILCLTWNCYLYEGEKTLAEQLEALSRDFNHVLLYMPEDKIQTVARYFKKYESYGQFHYFGN